MDDSLDFLRLFHSLLRYGVLLSVGAAGIVALVGYIRKSHIITWERTLAIVAMIMCHVQLLIGLAMYASRFKMYGATTKNGYQTGMSPMVRNFWKYEHIGIMILAIALVTIGRSLSKRAATESGKQLRVAIFYLIAMVLFLWGTPWPFTAIGHGRFWL